MPHPQPVTGLLEARYGGHFTASRPARYSALQTLYNVNINTRRE